MATTKKTVEAPIGETGTTQKAKVGRAKATTVAGIEQTFVVASKGYKETFTNREAAKSQFDTLKRLSLKNKQAAKITLSSRHVDNGTDTLLEELKIDANYFEQD